MLAAVTTPLLCVGIAFLLIYLPKIPLSVAMGKQPEGYDNKDPRGQQAKLTGWGQRARNAHANAFESFPAFAASVFVAHLGHGNEKYAAILAITYCVARAIYPLIYMANLGTARSGVWTIGFGATCGLFALPLLG